MPPFLQPRDTGVSAQTVSTFPATRVRVHNLDPTLQLPQKSRKSRSAVKMEGPSSANAAELPSSSPSATEVLVFNGNQEPIAFFDTRGQMNHPKHEVQLPVSMEDTMEDPQPSVIYHIEADRESETEDIHVTCQPNNMVDFDAGVQHTEVDSVPSESESEEETHESDDGDKSPMQYDSTIGERPRDDYEATGNTLSFADTTETNGEVSETPQQWTMPNVFEQAYEDVHDEERGVFVDFDGDADVDNDEERSVQEQDNQIEEDIGFGFGSIKAFVHPQTSEIISQHLSNPVQQSFTSLNDLLSSHNAPGRGLYNVEKVLEHEEGRAAELEEKMRYIEAELEEVRSRRDRANEIVQDAGATFSRALGAARIHDDLWKEYEAFCESLEPKFGNRGGWSVTCFENHNGSYVEWDPDLELFTQTAEMPLESCNFRCEATTIERMGRTEYVVEFWPLANPEPQTEAARTWEQQYVSKD